MMHFRMVVLVQALHDIPAGGELLDEYGERYWSNLPTDEESPLPTDTTTTTSTTTTTTDDVDTST